MAGISSRSGRTSPTALTNRIQNVLMPGTDNSSYAKPTEVVNLNVTKDAHLTLVFAAELAAWNNSIGYYFYDTKNPPKSMGELDSDAQIRRIPQLLVFYK